MRSWEIRISWNPHYRLVVIYAKRFPVPLCSITLSHPTPLFIFHQKFYICQRFLSVIVYNNLLPMMQDYSLYELQELFRKIAGGDTTAFKELFDAYKQKLYAAACKVAKSTDAAEDIVQEIFARIWENRSILKEVENPSAYIFTVAYHESFRYLKKVSSDQKLYEALRKRIKILEEGPEKKLELKETQQQIAHAIDELPPQRQLIYKLSREEGLSYKEIADKLHISPLTVKKQLQLALRNIRTVLSKMTFLLLLFIFIH
ncbi:MAG: RNA polymerase sigma-70 factor [Chitinophagaceae bacterium]